MLAPESGSAVDAVRAALDALGAPAITQALALENALAAKLADLSRVPDAVGFDPLARPVAGAVPARRQPSAPDTAGRKPQPSAMPAMALAGGVGALLGDVLAGKTTTAHPPPAVGALAGIRAALAALSGPASHKTTAGKTQPVPNAAQAQQAVRAVALTATGAVSEATGLGAQALAALPGGAGAAPVLGRIAALGNALWWQIALAPPGAQGTGPARRPARRSQRDAGTQTGGPSGHRQPTTRSAADGGSGVDLAGSALAGIGKLAVELFTFAAGGDDAPVKPGRHPAPRAPSVLVPTHGVRSTPAAPSGDTPPPLADVSTVSTRFALEGASADDLARALRAEGQLRGADLA